jgi:predicted nucleic acid-binding protein
MKRYALDANALIIHFEGRNGSERVQKILDAASIGEAEAFMSAINAAEVFSVLWKRHGPAAAKKGIQFIVASPVVIIDATLAVAIEAAEITSKFHVGLGDSYAALTALSRRAILVTADQEFHRFDDRFKILWLPTHKSVN